MFAVLSLLLILSISLIVTRIATVALTHTGLGREAARFQARSAFTGVGFTTTEAEQIVNHPVRRRIVGWLMVLGNVGIVTAMSSLLISVIEIRGPGGSVLAPLAALVGGIALHFWAASSQWLDQRMCRVISWALNRFTMIDARDYARLLHLREDYGVSEVRVEAGDWVVGKSLAEARLGKEGLIVLGIQRADGRFVGAPSGDTCVEEDDLLIVYGRTPRIAELDTRAVGLEGDLMHHEAMAEHEEVAQAEEGAEGTEPEAKQA